MDEQGFLQLLAEKPHNPEVLLVYADWLEEQGRDDDALATRLRRFIKDDADTFTREQAKTAQGYNGRFARKWFAKYAELRVVLVGYKPVTDLDLSYMPVGVPGRRRTSTPLPDDQTSAVLYHRKGHGYNGNQVAFIKVPDSTL